MSRIAKCVCLAATLLIKQCSSLRSYLRCLITAPPILVLPCITLLQVMCFPSSHLSLIKGATANSKSLKRIHSLVDIDITMDAFEEWPYDLQQVGLWSGGAADQGCGCRGPGVYLYSVTVPYQCVHAPCEQHR